MVSGIFAILSLLGMAGGCVNYGIEIPTTFMDAVVIVTLGSLTGVCVVGFIASAFFTLALYLSD